MLTAAVIILHASADAGCCQHLANVFTACIDHATYDMTVNECTSMKPYSAQKIYAATALCSLQH